MIRRLLVANRGEIARRVFSTCRDLGISSVAVFSDADTGAPHALEADRAVRLPGASPAETYLRPDLLITAALETQADAVHPGYGFLSENAEFARAVEDAGLTWVGPPPSSIAAMGSKIASKELMEKAGVPLLPNLDPETLTDDDFPVLFKASAGGGGRGMRVVRARAELTEALESARREATAAFGDSAVFCEPLLTDARHIEVQILADQHGTVWALGERECSIQRRHQKIVEETPSPAVDGPLRAALFETAVAAARAIGYVGAGTIEFMLDKRGRFYFLEANTRLQVEHPVTECVFGVDLVRLQLEVAEGAVLPPDPPLPRGHAMEVRLYAEDPEVEWRPQTGRLHRVAFEGVDARFSVPPSFGLRLDSGVEDGSDVSVHYDPMLAKVIAWGPTRPMAIRRLVRALATAEIHGVVTNRDLLVRVLSHPAFLAGETDTGFLVRHDLRTLAEPLPGGDAVRLSALAAALADGEHNRLKATVLAARLGGWRNVPSQLHRKRYEHREVAIEVGYRLDRNGLTVEGHDGITVVNARPDEVVLEQAGVRDSFRIARYDEPVPTVYVDSTLGGVALRCVEALPERTAEVETGSLLAPLTGVVARVAVEPGDSVQAGQPLLWLEAMKMEHVVAAPTAGVVSEIRVSVGQTVDVGTLLLVIDADEEGT